MTGFDLYSSEIDSVLANNNAEKNMKVEKPKHSKELKVVEPLLPAAQVPDEKVDETAVSTPAEIVQEVEPLVETQAEEHVEEASNEDVAASEE